MTTADIIHAMHEVPGAFNDVPEKMTNPGAGSWRFKHIFLDAEGTLYVPRGGRSRWSFWSAPSPERAARFFKLDSGAIPALMTLRGKAETLCVVSMNDERVLQSLLRKFGIASWFDCIMVNGDKGDRIRQYLAERGLRKEDALMVGDMPKLDLFPLRNAGIEAILVDRPYNRWARAERIQGLRDLPRWLDGAGKRRVASGGRGRLATLDEYIRGGAARGPFAADDGPRAKRLIAVTASPGAGSGD